MLHGHIHSMVIYAICYTVVITVRHIRYKSHGSIINDRVTHIRVTCITYMQICKSSQPISKSTNLQQLAQFKQ